MCLARSKVKLLAIASAEVTHSIEGGRNGTQSLPGIPR